MSNKHRTIAATLHAWLSPSHRIEGMFDSDPKRILPYLSLSVTGPDQSSWQKDNSYTYVGEATVSLRSSSRDELIAGKVESLKSQKRDVLAKAQAEATEIEGEIQKLLAISFDGGST